MEQTPAELVRGTDVAPMLGVTYREALELIKVRELGNPVQRADRDMYVEPGCREAFPTRARRGGTGMRIALALAAVAGMMLAPAQLARADTPKCKSTRPGGRYDFGGDSTSFTAGATGSGTVWSVKASDDVSYLSAKLVGGPAEGQVATWARVKLAPTASGVVWPVNRAARTFSILGVDAPRSLVNKKTDNGDPAAVKSRRCARDDRA